MVNQHSPTTLTLRRPDDWHLHLRQGDMLKQVLPYTSRVFQRAIIMPNLSQPITTARQAEQYRQEIIAACPATDDFTPLLTCYLTDDVDWRELASGYQQNLFTAAKLYPAHATTNSQHGVSDIKKLWPIFAKMQQWGMPLLLHGEVTDADIDIFDREAYFIDKVLIPLRRDFPELKIVLEHITTEQAATYVLAADDAIAATITPQHLLFNRNDLFVGGIRPHLYCLPILKRQQHQLALQAAIKSGCSRLFLGTDSAPHSQHRKESACGCAGVFNAPHALAVYAQIFEQCDALAHFEAFCSLNGPRFYQLPINQQTITLTKQANTVPASLGQGEQRLIPFLAGQTLIWQVNLPDVAH